MNNPDMISREENNGDDTRIKLKSQNTGTEFFCFSFLPPTVCFVVVSAIWSLREALHMDGLTPDNVIVDT